MNNLQGGTIIFKDIAYIFVTFYKEIQQVLGAMAMTNLP